MITDDQFKKATALLKSAAPTDEWENFIGAFQAYTFSRIGEVIEVGDDHVQHRIGGARECKKLLRLLEECDHKKPGGT